MTAKIDISTLQHSAKQEINKSIAENETEEEVEVENIERPVDLYKVTAGFQSFMIILLLINTSM